MRALGGRQGAATRARLFDEFAADIAEELDFEREARVAGEIADNLAGDPQVVVPAIHRELSTRRVLVMRYLPAIPIADRAALERARNSRARRTRRRSPAPTRNRFSSTASFTPIRIPGNLFVIDEAEAVVRPRVLFIDFGLSKHLDPALRNEMRLGIHALLRRDVEGFLDGMDRMGMIEPGARDGVRRQSRRCSSAWPAPGRCWASAARRCSR